MEQRTKVGRERNEGSCEGVRAQRLAGHHCRALGLLLLLFVLVAGWYSVRVPVGEGVDEGAHFAYVRYLVEQRRLPSFPVTGTPPVAMAHHPPLYYMLGALVIAPFNTSDVDQVLQYNPHFVWRENDGTNGWNVVLHYGQDALPWRGTVAAIHALRFVSVLLGAITVAACYATARLLLPQRPWAPLGAAALVGLNPSFIYASSTVHHDPLIICLTNLGILYATWIVQRGLRRADFAVGGLLVGGAMLTKLTGLTLLPVMLLSFLLAAQKCISWKRLAWETLGLVVVVVLVSGWWFLRNHQLYGDPLGWQMFRQIFWFNFRQTPYSWGLFRYELLAQLAATFWGAFGFMHITFPDITRYLWYATSLAGIGLFISIISAIHRGVDRDALRLWVVPISALVLVFAALVSFSIESMGAGHARYVFPSASAYAPLIVVGFQGLTGGRAQRAVNVGLVSLLLVYAIWLPAKHVWPLYARVMGSQ